MGCASGGPPRFGADAVGAENHVRAGHAACWYLWRMPPRRSCLRMLRWASRSGSIGSGSGRRGAAPARALPDRGRSDLTPQPCELALDPATPPARILFGQPQHQLFDCLRSRWTSGPAPTLAVVPPARDEPSMPFEKGPWSHREHPRPAPSGYQRGQRREPQPVRRRVPHRGREWPTQHRVLMPQDKKFGIAQPGPRAASSSLDRPARQSPTASSQATPSTTRPPTTCSDVFLNGTGAGGAARGGGQRRDGRCGAPRRLSMP